MPLQSSLFALLLLCAAPLVAQSFEGAISFQIQSDQQTGELQLLLSPKGIRAEFRAQVEQQRGATMLMLHNGADAVELNSKTKTYREIDLQDQRRLSASVGKLEKFEVEKLGEEMMLNVVCHHFKLKSPKRMIEVWTAKSLVDSTVLARIGDVGALIGISPNAVEAMRKENLNGFPLKVIATEPSGSARIEAKQMVRKPLNPSLFEVPKSYQKVE